MNLRERARRLLSDPRDRITNAKIAQLQAELHDAERVRVDEYVSSQAEIARLQAVVENHIQHIRWLTTELEQTTETYMASVKAKNAEIDRLRKRLEIYEGRIGPHYVRLPDDD